MSQITSSNSHGFQLKIKNSKLTTHLIVISILLLATFLRLYQLPALPPGLNFDEAGNGVAALDILNGTPKLWWQIGGGKEPLWPYLLALPTLIWGNTPLTLRLMAALVGILTLAAAYPLTLRLFRRSDGRQAHLIGLLTMLGLAVSDWHLHFSRLGFRAILLPLLSTLAFYFFWRTLRFAQRSTLHQHPIPLILAALFTALASYAYLAGRLLPFVPVLFLVLDWSLNKIRVYFWQRQKNSGAMMAVPNGHRRHLFRLVSIFLLLTLLFLLPLVAYFVANPADFTARSATVSIFNPAWHQGDPAGAIWRTFTTTLGTFLGFTGDPNPLVNLPGQPALPALLALFFIVGLLVSLYHTLRPPSSSVYPPHLFLMCWWVVMLLPALLAPEGAPHHLRLIGALVPTYVLVALGLTTLTNVFVRLLANTQMAPRFSFHVSRFIYLLPVLIYLLIACQTYTHYFIRWPASADFTLPFDLYAVRLADDIAHAPAEVSYVLPMDIRAGAEARHYTLDYLLAHDPMAPYTYLPVDEQNAETVLAQASAGKRELRLVRWTADKHHEADAKEIVTFLLAANARLLKQQSFPVYDIETYALNSAATFKLPTIDRPVQANFDNRLRLEAAFIPSASAAGKLLPVAVRLAPLGPMEADYKVSLRLLSPTGERIAQKDRILLHTYHQGASLWPPETVNEYYLLPVPSNLLPGNYTVAVVIYHPDTLVPLTANGLAEIPVGQVRIG